MKFFIDSANINEIKEALSLGMCDGVTTNPSLVAREKRPFTDVVKEILEAVPGPVSLEVVSLDAAGWWPRRRSSSSWAAMSSSRSRSRRKGSRRRRSSPARASM